MYNSHDGLAVGCGEKYGLFISADLSHGNSNPCITFDNDILS